jgi:hypothetical protein
MIGWFSTPHAAGKAIPNIAGTVPAIVRVVVAGLDLNGYLPNVPEGDPPMCLTSEQFVQLIAPYLREGLIDPWNGKGRGRIPPVITRDAEESLSFIQAVGYLN